MEGSQDIQSVPSFVQNISRDLTSKLWASLLLLYGGASPQDQSFSRHPGGTHDVIEPGRHDRAPVVEYPSAEHSEEFHGQSERKFSYPAVNRFDFCLLADRVRDPTVVCIDEK